MVTSGLLNLFALIIIFGVGLWLVNMFIPMPFAIKQLLNVLVVIVLILYILQFFGIIHTILPMFTVIR